MEKQDSKTFDSAMLKHGSYDEKEELLEITFPNGKVYQYISVPKDKWHDLKSAESAGQYFSKHIKGHYAYKIVKA
jgi:hypothetical protein